MNNEAKLQVFAAGLVCIDTINRHTGRGHYSNETLDQIRKRYPDATVEDLEEFTARKEKALCTDPVEISQDQYWEFLECLPPKNWQIERLRESFEMIEHTSGRVTQICVRLGRRYFAFEGIAGQSLDDNEKAVRRVFP